MTKPSKEACASCGRKNVALYPAWGVGEIVGVCKGCQKPGMRSSMSDAVNDPPTASATGGQFHQRAGQSTLDDLWDEYYVARHTKDEQRKVAARHAIEEAIRAEADELVAFEAKAGDEPPDDYARTWRDAGRAEAGGELLALREALTDARNLIAEWGAYASDYFQEKWGLADDLARIDALLDKPSEGEA